MFFIFNKDKITAYIVTVFTVMALFFTASVFEKNEETIQTSVNENTIINDTFENNVIENNEIINEK